jgi:hypothetical protein
MLDAAYLPKLNERRDARYSMLDALCRILDTGCYSHFLISHFLSAISLCSLSLFPALVFHLQSSDYNKDELPIKK